MTEEEKLQWYEAVYGVFQDDLNENADLIITGSFYWIDAIYNEMEYDTKQLCKVTA